MTRLRSVGYRAALRSLADFERIMVNPPDGESLLELSSSFVREPARMAEAHVVEGAELKAVPVAGEREAGFHAFLDGTQRSRVLAYVDGAPIVHATVAAVIRERVDRRLVVWPGGVRIERLVLASRRALPQALWAHLEANFPDLADLDGTDEPGPSDSHPMLMSERAVHMVQERREALEEQLAADWCESDGRMLALDGSLKRHDAVVRSTCATGIVKSHRTLYVRQEHLVRVLRLQAGERSSVFRLDHSPGNRPPVASWYLRLRNPSGQDPFWGLVRVEAADPQAIGESPADTTLRANRISRWILAEVSPLALPDARWDRMIYPIRDCEEYLRAIA